MAVAGALAGIAYWVRYEVNSWRIDSLHDSGIEAFGINLAVHSPAVEQALGTPIRETGLPSGEARMEGAGGYAQAVLRLEGPKSKAELCIVGNRNEDGWDVEGTELVQGHGRSTIDLTPPVSNEDVNLPSFGTVYLIPLGRSVEKLLKALPNYYRAKLGIEVKVLPALTPERNAFDPANHEVIAEKLAEFMRRSYPQIATDPTATLIGVTDLDMEDRGLGWDHTLNLRPDNRTGVISTKPLEPEGSPETANPLVFFIRLRKIITKNIGLLDFPLTLSNDPTSVLAANNGRPGDVDLMGEDFRNAAGVWVPGPGDEDATVDITRSPHGSLTWRVGPQRWPPTDTRSEFWEADLSIGLFVQKQTDFYYPEPLPVRFVRVYRPQDNWSRAFGIGTSDSFDPYLVGVYGSWIDLLLEDGSRIHYRRDRLKMFSQEYGDGAGWLYPFGETALRYNGKFWTLKRADGWTMTFPNSYGSHRSQQGAMTGLYDDHGHKFQIDRDSEGDLLRLVTPEGNRIDFRYDGDGRVVHAADNHGRAVDYAYDDKGRLVSVEDSTGRTERYFYDDKNDMTRIEDGAGHVLLTNTYDQAGWVVRQRIADGQTFIYQYRRDADGKVRAATFTDPFGDTIDYRFNSEGYWELWPHCAKSVTHNGPK